MKPLVIFVHGFNTADGSQSVNRLMPFFEYKDYPTRPVDYNWTGLVGVNICDHKMAHILATFVPEETIAVGHSNGCAILQEAAVLGAPFSQLVLINPALPNDALFGANPMLKRVHVWHSPTDVVVLGCGAFSDNWGDMGAVGYTGRDPRVCNYNKASGWSIHSLTHSDVFEPGKIDFFGPIIVQKVDDYCTA